MKFYYNGKYILTTKLCTKAYGVADENDEIIEVFFNEKYKQRLLLSLKQRGKKNCKIVELKSL